MSDSPNDNVYVIKCLDFDDRERFLGIAKTMNLDGRATEQSAVENEPGKEYCWDWDYIHNRTLRYTVKERAQNMLSKYIEQTSMRTRMWIVKIAWNR